MKSNISSGFVFELNLKKKLENARQTKGSTHEHLDLVIFSFYIPPFDRKRKQTFPLKLSLPNNYGKRTRTY